MLKRLGYTLVVPLLACLQAVPGSAEPRPAAVRAAGGGRILVETLAPDANVVKGRLVFSTVNEEIRPAKTVRISNTGTATLQVSSLSLGQSLDMVNAVAGRSKDHTREEDFILVDPPALPLALAPGTSYDLAVQYAPQRTATLHSSGQPTHTEDGESYAALTIASNDPKASAVVLGLAGINSYDFEGKNENSLAEIARAFGWTTDIGSEKSDIGGQKTLMGDEVYSPYWLRADTSRPVLLWPLARYSGRSDGAGGSQRWEAKAGSGGNLYQFAGRDQDDSPEGWEVPGSDDLSGGENQKVLLKILPFNSGSYSKTNTVPSQDAVDFKPSAAFSLKNTGGGSSTDDSLNGAEQLHNWRLYPVRDGNGQLVANTWLAAQDNGIDGEFTKNFDYNDAVFLLTNAKPEQAELDPAVPAAAPGAAAVKLYFSSTYTGTLTDNNGDTLGFTDVQLNGQDGYTHSASYRPDLLDLTRGDPGTLKVTTTEGTNEGDSNSLVNGLQLKFDGRNTKFKVSARLLGPLSQINIPNQRAGIMVGPNQDNYLRLTASARSNGSLALQFVFEHKGDPVYVGSSVYIRDPDKLQYLELFLLGDPKAARVQAAYRAVYTTGEDSGQVALATPVTLAGGQVGHFFAAQSKAGIFASSKDAPAITITYDNFAVSAN
ncbi:MAG: hypothetical protein KME03_04480 [Aphanocapsa lilacina HA4352-LM1]|jgi:hypothetical protein|nr:hypothetical protein [Aphanocapsa lilacina HA4352-LM1]